MPHTHSTMRRKCQSVLSQPSCFLDLLQEIEVRLSTFWLQGSIFNIVAQTKKRLGKREGTSLTDFSNGQV